MTLAAAYAPTDRQEGGAAATAARIGTGAALIAAPLLLTLGLAIHPEETKDAARQLQIVRDSSEAWDWAHCLILLSSVLFIPASLGMAQLLRGHGAWFGVIGAALTGLGAVLFGTLVGAAFTLSAAATLPAGEQAAAIPAIQASIDLEGPLALVLLGPIGIFAGVFVLGLGLWLAHVTPRWVSGTVLTGAAALLVLMLAEADIRVMAIAAAVLTAGMAGAGIQMLRPAQTPNMAPRSSYGAVPAGS